MKRQYLIWSNELGGFLAGASRGDFTRLISTAARYDDDAAARICQEENSELGPGEEPRLVPVLAPEWIEGL